MVKMFSCRQFGGALVVKMKGQVHLKITTLTDGHKDAYLVKNNNSHRWT